VTTDVQPETAVQLLVLPVVATMVAALETAAELLVLAVVQTMAAALDTVAELLLLAVVQTLVLLLAANRACWIVSVRGWLATRLAVVPMRTLVAAKLLALAVAATMVVALGLVLVPLVVAILTPLPLLLLRLSQFLPNRLLIQLRSTIARTASFKPA